MAENLIAPDATLAREIPGFLCVDHIAIAVPAGSLEGQVAAYRAMGFDEIHREDVGGGDRVREVLLRIGEGPSMIQLLEPISPDSPVQKAMERNGGRGGLNHIAFRVADIQAAFDALKAKGFRMIDEAPRPGSFGTTVFFLHPKGAPVAPLNVLIEVVQS